jgi:hypothetical protein
MASDPKDRFASVLQLATALAPFASVDDRVSVGIITGVLCGSMPPPARGPTLRPPVTRIPLESSPATVVPVPVPSEVPVTSSRRVPAIVEGPGARRIPWLATGAAGAAVLVAVALLSKGVVTTGRSPEAPASHQVQSAVPPTVSVQVRTVPPHARVRIDDGPDVVAPLTIAVPRDEHEHKIAVEADGFLPQVAPVQFASDVVVSVSLTPKR